MIQSTENMQSTKNKVTKAQARRAKARIVETLQSFPAWGDSGVGISRDESGYAIQLHLTHPMSHDIYDAICNRAGSVPVKTEVTGEVWAF